MLLKIIFRKCVMYVEEKWNSTIKSMCIKNKYISYIKHNQVDEIKYIFNFQSDNNCRKQFSFNLEDWWTMVQYHIGLPPAINRYKKLSVSGNSIN